MGELAFVFGPVGWQRENMGRALYERGGVYAKVFDAVCRECRGSLPLDLKTVVYPPRDANLDLSGAIDGTYFSQAALYAVEVALDALHRSHGVAPAAAFGFGNFGGAASAGAPGGVGARSASHSGSSSSRPSTAS